MRVRAAAAKAQPALKMSLLAMLIAAGVAQAAEQTLIYMNAKAQEQIALTLIARMPPARQ